MCFVLLHVSVGQWMSGCLLWQILTMCSLKGAVTLLIISFQKQFLKKVDLLSKLQSSIYGNIFICVTAPVTSDVLILVFYFLRYGGWVIFSRSCKTCLKKAKDYTFFQFASCNRISETLQQTFWCSNIAYKPPRDMALAETIMYQNLWHILHIYYKKFKGHR